MSIGAKALRLFLGGRERDATRPEDYVAYLQEKRYSPSTVRRYRSAAYGVRADPAAFNRLDDASVKAFVANQGTSATGATYEVALRCLERYLAESCQDLSEMSHHDGIAFCTWLKVRYSTATVKTYLAAAQGYARAAVGQLHLQGNPFADVKGPRLVRRNGLTAPVFQDDLAVLDLWRGTSPVDLRDQVVIALGYGMGLRISEMIDLDVDNIQGDCQALVWRRKGSVMVRREIPASVARVLEAYRRVIPARGPLLRATRGGQSQALSPNRWTRSGAWSRLSLRYRFAPHRLRAGYITRLYDMGMKPLEVMALADHASLVTTVMYLPERCKAPPDTLPDVLGRALPWRSDISRGE